MVLIGDVHIVTSPHIVADLNGEMPNDAAPPSDQATVTYLHDGVGHHRLSRHHAGRERHMRPDHGVRTNPDRVLVVDRRLRKTDHAAVPELPERLAFFAKRPNSPQFDDLVPPALHHFGQRPFVFDPQPPGPGFGHVIAMQHNQQT